MSDKYTLEQLAAAKNEALTLLGIDPTSPYYTQKGQGLARGIAPSAADENPTLGKARALAHSLGEAMKVAQDAADSSDSTLMSIGGQMARALNGYFAALKAAFPDMDQAGPPDVR